MTPMSRATTLVSGTPALSRRPDGAYARGLASAALVGLLATAAWGCGSKDAPAEPAAAEPSTGAAEAAPAPAEPAAPAAPAEPVAAEPTAAEPEPAAAEPATSAKSAPAGLAPEVVASTTDAPSAKAWVVVFSEFQCKHCKEGADLVRQVREAYGDQVRVTFMHNPLPLNTNSRQAARASLAAARQGKFWAFHDAVFAFEDTLTDAALKTIAGQAGLDVAQYSKDIGDLALETMVKLHRGIAAGLKFFGTPAFSINGKAVRGAQKFEVFTKLIDEEITAADDDGRSGDDWLVERIKENSPDLHAYLFAGKEAKEPVFERPKPKAASEHVYQATVTAEDFTRGPADALVTLVTFEDFQCPFCKKVQPTLAKLLETYPADVRLVFKHNPMRFHQHSRKASEAALCAADQGKFWEMHDLLFAKQRGLTEDSLAPLAEELELDEAAFKRCLERGKKAKHIDADKDLAQKVTARGTPNIFVNGRKVVGAKKLEDFVAVVDEELTKAKQLVAEGVPRKDVYKLTIADGIVFRDLELDAKEVALEGLPRRGAGADAPIQVVGFVDYQCPFSARAVQALAKAMEHEDLKGRVSFTVRQFPMEFHKQAMEAAKGAHCAAKQGKLWELHDALLDRQKQLADGAVAVWAGELGLDRAALNACMADEATQKAIDKDIEQGREAGAKGTPTFFLNGRRFNSPTGYTKDAFVDVLAKYFPNKG